MLAFRFSHDDIISATGPTGVVVATAGKGAELCAACIVCTAVVSLTIPSRFISVYIYIFP